MADIGKALDEPTSNGVTYYDESADGPKAPMPEGTYPSHVISVETAVRDVKGIYRALIYNVRIRIAPEAKETIFDAIDNEGVKVKVDGGQYSGYEVRSSGVFKFLHPGKSDEFESNPGGNKGYSNFCTVLGKEPKLVDVEINGETVKMKELQELKETDILGKPVLSVIRRGKPWTSNRDGKTRHPLEVKWFRSWADGEELDPDTLKKDDLPF